MWRDWQEMARSPAAPLLFGQLVMFTGIAAIFPVAPLYVRAHGGSTLDAAIFVAGALVANTVVQFPAGKLCDRIGRRPLLLGSRLVAAAVCFILFADAGPLWLLILLRMVQGVSAGAFVPALRASLIDLTPENQRAQRFSQLQACEMLGLLVGPLLGGAVALWRTASIFGVAGVGLLIGIVTMARIPETKPDLTGANQPAPYKLQISWNRRGVMVPALCLAAAGTVFSMYDVVWPQYLSARGFSTLVVGISISLYALPVIFLAQAAGRLADRSNRRRLVAAAFIITAACVAVYPPLHSLPVILAVGTLEALAVIFIEPTLFAILGDNSSSQDLGRIMGIGGMFQFGGSAIGAAVLGSLYGLDERFAFWGGAAALLLAGVLAAISLPRRRNAGPGAQGVSSLPILETEIT